MKVSVILPAFNEEAYLGPTLDSLRAAAGGLRAKADLETEIIVVDNRSRDRTAAIAREKGAAVVHEPEPGIARARNTGARKASGEVLVFVDADVIVPRDFLGAVHEAMSDPVCIGGGVDTVYRPRRLPVRLYLRGWRVLARLTGMVQGAAQFSRRDAFEQLAGYDESVWIGEDVDFVWRLGRLARRTGRSVQVLQEPRVEPSSRRFDRWPLWKILIWTNPVFIALFRRRKEVWGGWYGDTVR